MHFKCKMTTKFGKLMANFCERQSMNKASVRFLFDGERINENQTPADVRAASTITRHADSRPLVLVRASPMRPADGPPSPHRSASRMAM